MLVLTGNVVGLVFKCLWPLGVGVFVIRHHGPKCSWLVFVKLDNVGYCKTLFVMFLLPEEKLRGLRKSSVVDSDMDWDGCV